MSERDSSDRAILVARMQRIYEIAHQDRHDKRRALPVYLREWIARSAADALHKAHAPLKPAVTNDIDTPEKLRDLI